eukprot:COSAG05_NODE_2144_length_3483_cov_4.181147_3_plen_41_part_00
MAPLDSPGAVEAAGVLEAMARLDTSGVGPALDADADAAIS